MRLAKRLHCHRYCIINRIIAAITIIGGVLLGCLALLGRCVSFFKRRDARDAEEYHIDLCIIISSIMFVIILMRRPVRVRDVRERQPRRRFIGGVSAPPSLGAPWGPHRPKGFDLRCPFRALSDVAISTPESEKCEVILQTNNVLLYKLARAM